MDLSEYSAPTPISTNLPGTKWICIDFEKAAHGASGDKGPPPPPPEPPSVTFTTPLEGSSLEVFSGSVQFHFSKTMDPTFFGVTASDERWNIVERRWDTDTVVFSISWRNQENLCIESSEIEPIETIQFQLSDFQDTEGIPNEICDAIVRRLIELDNSGFK